MKRSIFYNAEQEVIGPNEMIKTRMSQESILHVFTSRTLKRQRERSSHPKACRLKILLPVAEAASQIGSWPVRAEIAPSAAERRRALHVIRGQCPPATHARCSCRPQSNAIRPLLQR